MQEVLTKILFSFILAMVCQINNQACEETRLKTLVLGVGNTILSDDSAGCRVAQALKCRFDEDQVTVLETSRNWLDILDLLPGYDKAIIIDGIQTKQGKVGEVYRLTPEDFDAGAYAISPHHINFGGALKVGKGLGMALPQEIVIFAIEVADVTTWSENCTSEVELAIQVCAEMVIQELEHAYSKY